MKAKNNFLSIIVPCFNESNNIEYFLDRTLAVLNQLINCHYISGFELIFVDDGSTDSTLQVLKKFSESVSQMYYISFCRNFGKEAAMLAGLRYAFGDIVSIMDADLQDPPELLLDMFKKFTEIPECECVVARRTTRTGESFVVSSFSRLFYKIINKISDVKIESGARDFRIMSRKVVDAILDLQEKSRFSKGLFIWPGYKTEYIEYKNVSRFSGKSKWSFFKLVRYSLDGITAFSVIPLQFATFFGFIFCIISLLATLFFVAQKLIVGIEVKGYAFLICAIFLLGGMILFFLGVVGQYISQIFIEVKGRPSYIIKSENVCRRTDGSDNS